MFILNKKKFFNDIYYEIFKKTMISIDDMNNILTYYGAKPYIEKDKMKFVLSTFLFNLFFIEGALQQKYWPKYKEDIRQIIEAMLDEIAHRTGYIKGKIYDVYTTVRSNLGNMSLNDDELKSINPFCIATMYYLTFTFNDEYKPEELGNAIGETEAAIATVFQNILNETTRYLDSL